MKYALALTLLVAAPIHAQTPKQPIEISPFAGYLFGGSFAHPSVDPSVSRVVVSDHSTFGVRAGFNVTSRIEPEIQWSRTETEMNFDATDNGPHLPLTINYFLAGANYNFSAGRIRPYVSLSLGAARLENLRADSTGVHPATNFAGSVGAGVKGFLTPNLGLRLEARGYASQLPQRDFVFGTCLRASGTGQELVPVPCGDKWLFNGDLTAGLVLAF